MTGFAIGCVVSGTRRIVVNAGTLLWKSGERVWLFVHGLGL